MTSTLHSFKPTRYSVLYPRSMAGKPLLYFSCILAALGDALFGYSQGITAAFHVQPSFLHRMYHKDLSVEEIQRGATVINPFLIAITIACLDITALFGSFGAAYLNDSLGRRMSIRLGACIYFVSAFVQMFAQNLPWLIAGRSFQGIGGISLQISIGWSSV
ncbi:hypothetical protein PM082_020914 [Marasmius tenuissimus]|nr:hypothetical protein PM082_020914 [Marasmius tenuissimus]